LILKNKDFFKRFLSSKPLVNSKSLQYSGLGVQLAVTILVFLFIGIWIDKALGTIFWFTLLFTLLGFFGGFYSFYLNIKKLNEDSKREKNESERKL
jgi:F0F1-type ATP synthase assembly protein I